MSEFSQNQSLDESRGTLTAYPEKLGHKPVLLSEVIKYLEPKPGGKFIDATIDGGRHALAVMERIKPNGILLGLEWDPVIYASLKPRFEVFDYSQNLILANESYIKLADVAQRNDLMGADGIFFDLGMSSWHIEESGRGFSFMRDEPLDMRYDPTGSRETAASIINKSSPDQLEKVIKEYGEERFSQKIVRKIVEVRKHKPIMTTFQLVEAVKEAVPFWYRRSKIHYATRTFQALRIAVNHELENLEVGLEQSEKVLKAGGRLAVISFHSLEDRIVKNFFRETAKAGIIRVLTKKPIRAGLTEITENPRARSAKLRVAERI